MEKLTKEMRRRLLEDLAHQVSELIMSGHRHLHEELMVFNITPPQFFVLKYLSRKKSQCAMNELANATLQEAAVITGVVDRLEKAGLVMRIRDTHDRRKILVQTTPKGEEVCDNFQNGNLDNIAEIVEALSDEEVIQLVNSIKKLIAEFKRVKGIELPSDFEYKKQDALSQLQ